MGVPKGRMSKCRTRMRRSIWTKIEMPQLSSCPQCHELILPHRVCPACGYYKAREIVKDKAKAKK
ncbi:MAG TPA: 50S ribosomal protein L32 [Spirochaetia bacterium]|nr:50S ribosomal protein L32 [Spirochaetia bacterium]